MLIALQLLLALAPQQDATPAVATDKLLRPSDAVALVTAGSAPSLVFEGAEAPHKGRTPEEIASLREYIEVGQGSGNLKTNTTHGDAHLHVEWYCPSGGEGDTRSNSGVYLHGRYEVQIFGTPAGDDPTPRGAGSIYGIAAPTVNASTGPDTWQTYDIYFTAPRFEEGKKVADARLSMDWNGERVHDNVPIPKPTGSSEKETETPTGNLLFQDYQTKAKGPVRLRNVWIRELGEPAPWQDGEWSSPLTEPDQWFVRGGKAHYEFKDGILRGETRPNTGNTFYTSVDTYANFELTYDAKVDPQLNSGVQIRSHPIGGPNPHDGGLSGYQIEIDPSDRSWSAGLYEERGRGWLHPLHMSPPARSSFQQSDWNNYRVRVEGPRIRTWINGIPAVDAFDAKATEGHIGFQVHGVGAREDPLTVEWRNVRLRKLVR